MIVSYPNQKIIKVRREKVDKSKGTFLNIYESSIEEAMNILTNSAFKVYICLVSNADGYRFSLSPTAIKDKTHLCLDTVRKALKELEIKNYIKYVEGNQYEFYEIPNYNKQLIDKNN